MEIFPISPIITQVYYLFQKIL